ncbi:unnamed protein product [Pleuronectes platessa]|uniref:Uncharacterized protein n=1 Tax=Pleuronectes platessa TaxID=8262 RepID=A0A9N7W0F4_PLEPL|nr:unnamed protein product [Pleuronectes platessa]
MHSATQHQKDPPTNYNHLVRSTSLSPNIWGNQRWAALSLGDNRGGWLDREVFVEDGATDHWAGDKGAALCFNLLLSAGSPLSSPGPERQGSTPQFTLLSLPMSQVIACVTSVRHECGDQHCRGQLLPIERPTAAGKKPVLWREVLVLMDRSPLPEGSTPIQIITKIESVLP